MLPHRVVDGRLSLASSTVTYDTRGGKPSRFILSGVRSTKRTQLTTELSAGTGLSFGHASAAALAMAYVLSCGWSVQLLVSLISDAFMILVGPYLAPLSTLTSRRLPFTVLSAVPGGFTHSILLALSQARFASVPLALTPELFAGPQLLAKAARLPALRSTLLHSFITGSLPSISAVLASLLAVFNPRAAYFPAAQSTRFQPSIFAIYCIDVLSNRLRPPSGGR